MRTFGCCLAEPRPQHRRRQLALVSVEVVEHRAAAAKLRQAHGGQSVAPRQLQLQNRDRRVSNVCYFLSVPSSRALLAFCRPWTRLGSTFAKSTPQSFLSRREQSPAGT